MKISWNRFQEKPSINDLSSNVALIREWQVGNTGQAPQHSSGRWSLAREKGNGVCVKECRPDSPVAKTGTSQVVSLIYPFRTAGRRHGSQTKPRYCLEANRGSGSQVSVTRPNFLNRTNEGIAGKLERAIFVQPEPIDVRSVPRLYR